MALEPPPLQPLAASGGLCQQRAAVLQTGGRGGTEGNHRLAGEIIGFHKAAGGPGGNVPPDGIAHKYGIVVRPVLRGGNRQRYILQGGIIVLLGNPAVFVCPVQIIRGIGVCRYDLKEVRAQGFRDGLRHGPGASGSGKIGRQDLAASCRGGRLRLSRLLDRRGRNGLRRGGGKLFRRLVFVGFAAAGGQGQRQHDGQQKRNHFFHNGPRSFLVS